MSIVSCSHYDLSNSTPFRPNLSGETIPLRRICTAGKTPRTGRLFNPLACDLAELFGQPGSDKHWEVRVCIYVLYVCILYAQTRHKLRGKGDLQLS